MSFYASIFDFFGFTSPPTLQKLTRHKIKIPVHIFNFYVRWGDLFPKSTKWPTFSNKICKKIENVIFFISSYIKNLLEIVVKLKINKRSKDLGALLDSCSRDDLGNFLQTCIKKSLLQTKSTEIWVNSHTVPHYACINLRSYSTP